MGFNLGRGMGVSRKSARHPQPLPKYFHPFGLAQKVRFAMGRLGRGFYALAAVVLLGIEVLIALFVRDAFIRPYGGDVLVTVLLCCLVRAVWPVRSGHLLPLWIFLFALAVELGQAIDLVARLGLADNRFFSTLLGRSFSPADIVCYAVGCLLFAGGEALLCRTRRPR